MNQENPNSKFIFVAFSLGSKILLDAINELEKKGQIDTLRDRVEMIYLMTNQVPLISLGTEPPSNLG